MATTIKSLRRGAARAARRYGIFFAILALWEFAAKSGLADSVYLPTLETVAGALYDLWVKAFLFTHIMVSLTRVVTGLAVALCLGVPLALLLGRIFPASFARLEALLRIFALVNPYCLFPLFVVFFGVGETPKIAVLAWVSLWPIFFSALSAFKNVDPILVKTALATRATPFSLFRAVILPASLPSVFHGVRLGVEMSFFILIAAEMTGATAGLGWIIHNAGALNQVDRIYAAGVCVVFLGVALNWFTLYLKRGLFFWDERRDPFSTMAPGGARRPVGRGRLAIAVAVFLALMAVGAWRIFEAERLLNDPSTVHEYHVSRE
ncbi:MAG: ABC transporter permease [Deltaproteobacteria bacterium]|nr:ABC transporter permease [Deltaproteobacteria bacterium]